MRQQLPLLFVPVLLLGLSAVASASVVQSINGTEYSFDFCQPLTSFGQLCWLTAGSLITISYSMLNPTAGGYVGVGFSPGSMLGSSAVVGWAGGGEPAFISNFDLTSYNGNSPGASTLQLSNASVTVDGGGVTTLLFTRPLQTPANSACTIDPSGSNTVIHSYGAPPATPQSVQQHFDQQIDSVSFTTGAVVAVEDPLLPWRRAHGCLMSIAFGLLIPLGIIAARFFKGFGAVWFHLHRALVLGGLALVLAAFVIAMDKLQTGLHHTHRGIGIYVFSAMMFQPLNAVVRPHPPAAGAQPSTLRRAWQALHHWNARIAYVFAIVNIYIGFSILEPGKGYVALFSVLWCLVMLLAVALQLWTIFRSSSGPTGDAAHPQLGKEVELPTPALDSSPSAAVGAV